jgi:hypothetical protein
MTEFRYVSSEAALAEVVTTSVQNWRPQDVVRFRSHLFTWAHLQAQAIKQCAERHRVAMELFAERIEAAERYWPAEVDSLREMHSRWSPICVSVSSLTRFALFASPPSRQEASVTFSLDVRDGITVLSTGVSPFPLSVREPANEPDALAVARALVLKAMELLAPFEGKLPSPMS